MKKERHADCVIARYSEIALKKGNRRRFEEKLVDNIKTQLTHHETDFSDVKRIPGRIIIDSEDPKTAAVVAKVFGVSSASPAKRIPAKIPDINKKAYKIFKNTKPEPESFRISANRLEKTSKTTSQKINEKVGAFIVEKTGCKVNLTNPGLTLGVELCLDTAYIHTTRIQGPGGIPVGMSGKVAVLFSGGIDSPVAAWLLMRRGCRISLIHFMHADSVNRAPKKLVKLRDTLRAYHSDIDLVCIPAGDIERQLIMNTPAKYRIIMLRRIFLKITSEYARKTKMEAIASGDNLAQVASQTLKNMAVIDSAAEKMWLRPLATFNKQEIIDLAKKIRTYEESIQEYCDCCHYLLPKHPSTGADEKTIRILEEKINSEIVMGTIDQAFKAK